MRPCLIQQRTTFSGYASCQDVHKQWNTLRDYFSTTNTLRTLMKSNKDIFHDFKDILNRLV